MIKAIDVSSYQSTNLTNLIEQFSPDVVITKLYLPEEYIKQSHTILQSSSAHENGKLTGGYCWAYESLSPVKTINDAVVLADICGSLIRGEHDWACLWIDAEDSNGPSVEWLRKAFVRADKLGVKAGIYTGSWWWNSHMQGVTEFSNRPLWHAYYNKVQDLVPFVSFGGWESCVGHQYTSTPIDQNVFLGDIEQTMNQAQLNEINTLADILDNPNDFNVGYDAYFDRIAQAIESTGYGYNDSANKRIAEEIRGIASRLRNIPNLQ